MMFDASTKYGILGMARSGIAAAYKIKELGGNAFLSEVQWKDKIPAAKELIKNFDCEFGGHTDRLLDCDVLIVSPGIPLDLPIILKARQKGIELISEIEFGFRIKAPDSTVIAVTGSNGKSTTASMIHHILEGMGKKSILAGNIGDAFCSFPIHKPGIEYIVLEISSFQLDLIQSFAPHVAVLLNITPDHLNRYPNFEAYSLSKMRIFSAQQPEDYAIIHRDSIEITRNAGAICSQKLDFSIESAEAAAFLDDKFISIDGHKLSIYELQIMGPHNILNSMAALLAIKALQLDLKNAMKACKSFKALPHRLEYVDSINGVMFYNDSKATNCDSVRSALESFDKPIRVILGGSNKGEDFSVLTNALQKHATKAYITGETQDLMRQAWLGKLPLHFEDDFKECIRAALDDAAMGDNIVLSPACASFDHFLNFEHRGETFKAIVKELKREKE
ncbi:MAG: UDP-N-acetylmuramoyl-L-alanine--D-glutamate ligase [Candidatus Cloacimonetes bacterium]|nr:UDP-N-acetylmuramoyl-L-alanine--D-glutamate ligase [Candidatus Cloacimonadota bacterium]